MNKDEYESSPWSNNSPNGPDVPVLLACLPSIPSNVYAINILTAATTHTQVGIGFLSWWIAAVNP